MWEGFKRLIYVWMGNFMVRRKCTLFLPSIIKKSRLKENFMKKSIFTLVIDILDSQVFILKSHWCMNLKYSSYLKLSHGANRTLVGVHVLVGRASSISVRLFKQKTILIQSFFLKILIWFFVGHFSVNYNEWLLNWFIYPV